MIFESIMSAICQMPSKEQALNIYVANVEIFLVNYFITKWLGA